MKNRSVISIAMATFNGGKFLHDQLLSFLNQTILPDELIIFDDNSTDNTAQIIEEFSKKVPFLVKFYKNNSTIGYTKNFEKAISETKGDYIFLSDQDDVWYPIKIQRIISYFNENPNCWLVVNDQNFVNSNLEDSGISHLNQLKKFGFPEKDHVAGCCTAFRKELKTIALPFEYNIHSHDTWLHIFAEILNRKFVYAEILQNHRMHDKNVSNGILKKRLFSNPNDYLNEILFTNHKEKYKKKYRNRIRILKSVLKRSKSFKTLTISELENLDVIILAHEARLELYNSGFIERKIKAIKMLLIGQYNQFNGYRSFIKDFII